MSSCYKDKKEDVKKKGKEILRVPEKCKNITTETSH
jgi:hypothetical protein